MKTESLKQKATLMKTHEQIAGSGRSLKRILQKFSAFTCLMLGMLAFCATNASAQLFWDAGNTNNGSTINAGSGAWDIDTTTNINWNNGSGNVSFTQTSISAGNQAVTFVGLDAAE